MSDILKFEIVSMDDEGTTIVFKSPDDLIKFCQLPPVETGGLRTAKRD